MERGESPYGSFMVFSSEDIIYSIDDLLSISEGITRASRDISQ